MNRVCNYVCGKKMIVESRQLRCFSSNTAEKLEPYKRVVDKKFSRLTALKTKKHENALEKG